MRNTAPRHNRWKAIHFGREQEPVHLGDEGTGDDNYRPRG